MNKFTGVPILNKAQIYMKRVISLPRSKATGGTVTSRLVRPVVAPTLTSQAENRSMAVANSENVTKHGFGSLARSC